MDFQENQEYENSLLKKNLISYFKYFNKLPLVCVDKAFVKTTALHANFEQSIIQFIQFVYYIFIYCLINYILQSIEGMRLYRK